MNRLAALACMVMLAVAIVGCEKSTEIDKPDVYNPSVNAPPSNLNVSMDDRIIKDQGVISKQYSAAPAKESTGAPAAGESPATVSPEQPAGESVPPTLPPPS